MKRITWSIYYLIMVAFIILAVTTAHAGAGDILGSAKGWFTGKMIAGIVTFVLGIGALAIYTDIISLVLISIGSLLVVIGTALLDKKLSSSEWADIKASIANLKDTVKEARHRWKERKNNVG